MIGRQFGDGHVSEGREQLLGFWFGFEISISKNVFHCNLSCLKGVKMVCNR